MAIIKCPECGHQISEKATVCPSCGVEIAGKIAKCTFCGEVFFKDSGLCPHCYRPYQSNDIPGDAAQDAVDLEVVEEHLEAEEELKSEELAEEEVASTPQPAREEDAPSPQDEEGLAEKDSLESEGYHPDPEDKEDDEASSNISENSNDAEDIEDDTVAQDNTDTSQEDADDEIKYIDTDGENLEKPQHEASDDDGNNGTTKRGYLPVVVSFAIAALIAAVCLYFYNDSKLSIENKAFDVAYDCGDVDQMNTFLRNHPDATDAHKKAISLKIKEISKQREDYSMGMVTRDKSKLQQYLVDYPNSPHKQTIIAIIDSIDWEEALRTNNKEGYDKYIAEHSSGLFIKEAKEKVSVKISESTAEDQSMAKSLYREFFLSVNGNDASRITPTLSSTITQFMGTSNATNSDVIGWMKRQHGDGVSNVIWKLNHDYKITRREQNGNMEYIVEFTAKQTINHKDGRTTNENFKISSNISENKKISSMTMTKYTPSSNTESTSKPSSTTSKPAGSPTASSNNSPKPSTGGAAKSSSSTTSKSGSNPSKPTTSKPSGSSSSQSGKPSSTTSSSKTSNSQSGAKKSSDSGTSSSNKQTSQQGKSTSSQSTPKSGNNPSKGNTSSSSSKK